MKYDTVQQYLRKLKLQRIKKMFCIIGISCATALSIGIIYVCAASGNDTQNLNKCLQNHSLNYCNKEVK